jgi:hypothetical protein
MCGNPRRSPLEKGRLTLVEQGATISYREYTIERFNGAWRIRCLFVTCIWKPAENRGRKKSPHESRTRFRCLFDISTLSGPAGR